MCRVSVGFSKNPTLYRDLMKRVYNVNMRVVNINKDYIYYYIIYYYIYILFLYSVGM